MNFWSPEEVGDKLEGEVMEIKEGDYGTQYLIDTGKAQMLTPSHKVLQNRMKKASVGTQCMIEFTGTEPPKVKGQNPTKMYKVYFKE